MCDYDFSGTIPVESMVTSMKQTHQESDRPCSSPTMAQLTLQICCLHKGFLALSDAFGENLEVSRRQELQREAEAASMRHEFASKLAAVEALRSDYYQLGSVNAELQQQNARLEDQVKGLEQTTDRLREQLEQVADQHQGLSWQLGDALSGDLPAAFSAAGKAWAARKLPRLARQALWEAGQEAAQGDEGEAAQRGAEVGEEASGSRQKSLVGVRDLLHDHERRLTCLEDLQAPLH